MTEDLKDADRWHEWMNELIVNKWLSFYKYFTTNGLQTSITEKRTRINEATKYHSQR